MKLHEQDVAFRGLLARSAPRLHAILAAQQARRLLPLGLAVFALGGALAVLASGTVRWAGVVGLLVGAAVGFEAWRQARKSRG